MLDKENKVIIIGAGPAGLTAAYELINKAKINPVIYEKTKYIGGISRTIIYKGNRADIGGHRFFSKSDIINQWWQNILPLENNNTHTSQNINTMLLRSRSSRILYKNILINYPIEFNLNTIKNIGILRMIRITISYIGSSIFKRKEKSLEDFFINRFGNRLYQMFFKEYTEKVWGLKCKELSSKWGRQRVKSLSISKIITDILPYFNKKNTATSLIKAFYYPKLGAGQMWEIAAKKVIKNGGSIKHRFEVVKIYTTRNKITSIDVLQLDTNTIKNIKTKYLISSMPIKDFILRLDKCSKTIKKAALKLSYRSFIIVCLLVDKKSFRKTFKIYDLLSDSWVYVQDASVRVGRIQIFNNWSSNLVRNYKDKLWIGLEYFCNNTDSIWKKNNKHMLDLAIHESEKLKLFSRDCVIDGTVIREEKAYPVYPKKFTSFDKIKQYVSRFDNLFLIGRNGMHRYNNMDHSMMTAIRAVENIMNGIKDKSNIWEINISDEYHEK